jgi:DNA-directed RNA polymerase specialized sigma24 family protein
LRNADWADDAVCETLLAALQKKPDLAEPGRVRAGLFGILRHNVVDQLRQPQLHADAFLMRECWGQDKTQICDTLVISVGNLFVMLHRTRQRLRQTLSEHRA